MKKEIADEYIKRFIMMVEIAGETTGNEVYKRVDQIVNESRESLDEVLEECDTFMMVNSLISDVLSEVYQPEEAGVLDITDKAIDFYNRYLRTMTEDFIKQYGLEGDKFDISNLQITITSIL